ncbi:hypothetical protein SSIL_3471 [Solibacillus silvestris StLB046]|uniref:Uncharacterized protein n=1 Tax=Solibacillus silvestris (strain StLB046) TaxID=1002809 RepID=F2F7D5_SOLSS|nr:hypothetical protein [Solibacillus silvestris]BAK17894.1 hypothetical protein SSIL_3471 [Solibacillus silvestris StLB046]
MKISSLARGFSSELDERRRSQLRKEAGEVYKKHAQYTDPSKNPLLKVLENLLSGKTEKDLLKSDNADQAENLALPTDITYSQTPTLDNAYLASAVPSSQDLLTAANVSTSIPQTPANTQKELTEQGQDEEAIPLSNENLSFTIPEKFQQNFARNPDEKTVFGQELEKRLFQRSFNIAAQKYSAHIAMVNNGYRLTEESVFSQIA